MDRFDIYFTHPQVQNLMLGDALAKQFRSHVRPCIQKDGSLRISTGANQITWGYGLNTMTYQTYGGEVVQILSAYIDDLSIGGDVQSYAMMEDIYIWFLLYMSVATQGAGDAGQPGVSSYSEEPVTMYYPHRQWTFSIKPKALPGLRMARDVVAPTWQMTAAVVEADPEVEAFTLAGAMEGLKEIQAGIGFEEENPFSSPSGKKYDADYVLEATEQATDWYSKIVSAYSSGDVEAVNKLASKPAISARRKESGDEVEEVEPTVGRPNP